MHFQWFPGNFIPSTEKFLFQKPFCIFLKLVSPSNLGICPVGEMSALEFFCLKFFQEPLHSTVEAKCPPFVYPDIGSCSIFVFHTIRQKLLYCQLTYRHHKCLITIITRTKVPVFEKILPSLIVELLFRLRNSKFSLPVNIPTSLTDCIPCYSDLVIV
jgi:hypothetical protein